MTFAKPLSTATLLLVLAALGVGYAPVSAASDTGRLKRPSAAMDVPSPTGLEKEPPGGLFMRDDKGKRQAFPLEHTAVSARIAGNVSRVEVTQRFHNPFKKPLEAIYVFPLPDEAAVDEMEIRIGNRVIKGNIKRREEARKIYEDAKREGRTAGLLEQERDNIFTQALANIRPGERIEVTIRYSDSLKFEGGDYEFVFPMVVGPRYIPAGVADANRITPPVLKPGTRSGHDIAVTVAIGPGLTVSNVRSPSHDIRIAPDQGTRVTLAPHDTIPNKDLILRYRVAGARTQAAVLTAGDARGGHFGLYLVPALDVPPREVVPKDVVFLMDTSGSQSGDPIAKSQELMRRFIAGLNPDDTFTVMDFATVTTRLSAGPLANTAANRKKALSYINALEANGGTELMNGIHAVLEFPAAPKGRLRSIVLITDGYIGNEAEVLAEVQRHLAKGNRLYSFGVGSGVNRFLLNRLAEVGRGTVQVVRADESSAEVAEKFFRQINDPVLTDIVVFWQGPGPAPQIYPQPAPDLFANQPLVLFGRKPDGQPGQLRITGTVAGGRRYNTTLPVTFAADASNESPAIGQLWARARLKDLSNRMFGGETPALVKEATETALAYRLLSGYTAFVAVSEEVRVNPRGKRITVDVPVELPEGVSYDGIFGQDEQSVGNASNGRGSPHSPMGIAAPGPMWMSRMTQPLLAPKPVPVPGMALQVAKEPERKREAGKGGPAVTLARSEGLSPALRADLVRYLATIKLPAGHVGDATFTLKGSGGSVGTVVLDAKQSTLDAKALLDPLQEALRAWRPSVIWSGTCRITLYIETR